MRTVSTGMNASLSCSIAFTAPEARPLEICEVHLAPNISIIPHGSNSPIVEQLEFWLCRIVDWIGSIFASLALHDQIIARPTEKSQVL